MPRALEPRMLVGGVVDDQLGDDPHTARVRRLDEPLHIRQRAVVGMHAAIVGDVVAVVAPRRRVERQQPDRVHAEVGDVVELARSARRKSPMPSLLPIEERLDVDLVDDRVLVPQRIQHRRVAALRWGSERPRMANVHPTRTQPPDAERQIRGIEPDTLILAVPDKIVAAHQIRHRDRGVVVQSELPQRHLDRRFLRDVRIEADRDQNHAAVDRVALP